MLSGQCFCGDFGALGFRKTAFHGPAVAFFQNTLLPSRQPEKPPQRKTNHSEKSFKTLQQAAKLCRRQDGSRLQISCNVEAAPPEGHIIHEQAPFACEGCLWLQAAGLVGRRLIANHAKTQKTAAAESACRQYRVVRWFLLPEGELRRRLGQSSGLQILLNNEPQRRNSPVRLSGQAATSSTLPHTTMRPPALPPPGPMSMM